MAIITIQYEDGNKYETGISDEFGRKLLALIEVYNHERIDD